MNNNDYINKIRYEYLRYRDILYDKITLLPTVPLIIETLRKILDKCHLLGIIVVDLSKYGKYERAYGWQKIDRIIENISKITQDMVNSPKWKNTILSVNRARGDDIILFVKPKSRNFNADTMKDITKKFVNKIRKEIDKDLIPEMKKNFKLHTGYSIIFNDPNVRLERIIYRGIKEASIRASHEEQIDKEYRIALLKRIIAKKEITAVFQPIVNIVDKKIIGYEALTRGPKNNELHNPELLFSVAEEGDLIWELERICREKALSNIDKLDNDKLMFINNEPSVIYDPKFQALEIIKKLNVSPDRIILEITERTAIEDFDAFKKALYYFKSVGFKISIDDAGAGYASLQSIAMLAPDFIKFDINLIRNINNDLIKQNLISSLLDIAEKINAVVIAEGIENNEENETVKRLGVKYGQGFYFAKPGPPFPKVDFTNK